MQGRNATMETAKKDARNGEKKVRHFLFIEEALKMWFALNTFTEQKDAQVSF